MQDNSVIIIRLEESDHSLEVEQDQGKVQLKCQEITMLKSENNTLKEENNMLKEELKTIYEQLHKIMNEHTLGKILC